MSEVAELPAGLQLVRSTPVFDEDSVPRGLLSAHQVAAGVWGRLVVAAGAVDFVFEDEPDAVRHLATGDTQVIPPAAPHHLVITGAVRFHVEFHR